MISNVKMLGGEGMKVRRIFLFGNEHALENEDHLIVLGFRVFGMGGGNFEAM